VLKIVSFFDCQCANPKFTKNVESENILGQKFFVQNSFLDIFDHVRYSVLAQGILCSEFFKVFIGLLFAY